MSPYSRLLRGIAADSVSTMRSICPAALLCVVSFAGASPAPYGTDMLKHSVKQAHQSGGRRIPMRPPLAVEIPGGQGGSGEEQASPQPPGEAAPQAADEPSNKPQVAPQVQTGQTLFLAQCAFCHGRDAAGGETGPDLTSSELVEKDVGGNEIGPVVRSGRLDKGMPPFNLPETDLAALVAFIHDQKTKADAKPGRRRSVQAEDLQTGSAEEGKQYFEGAGGCSNCHSPTGDLAGVANRLRGLALLERMLYPRPRRGGPSDSPATVTVRLPSGQIITGKLVYQDEFVIGLADSSGWYRSWFKSEVKVAVNNPLEAHSRQLGRYTDETMHNVLAYLQTLR